MKHYYIYKITFLCGNLAGCYYIGKRTTIKNIEDDNYFGSGVIPKKYYKKYPPIIGETIQKEILEICNSKEELADKEKVWIADLYLTDDKCVNKKAGGDGGFAPELWKGKHLSEEHRRKLSEAAKLRTGEKNSFYGKKHSEETLNKISKSLKGKKSGENNPMYGKGLFGESNGMYGKHHSEETRKKMSEKRKGRIPWNKGLKTAG